MAAKLKSLFFKTLYPWIAALDLICLVFVIFLLFLAKCIFCIFHKYLGCTFCSFNDILSAYKKKFVENGSTLFVISNFYCFVCNYHAFYMNLIIGFR